MPESEIIDQKYQIVRPLGQGGMGAVFEARHLGTGRRVAVKVILNAALAGNYEVFARFQREARAAGAIESLHIVQVLDMGVDRQTGHPYLVMEYLTGEDLSRTLERAGALAPDLALRIVVQTCLGLQKAHEAGVVHRDIKPANIFLARHDAGQILVKLLDFGIAKAKEDPLAMGPAASLTHTGAMLGSPYYMSPEQAIGTRTVDHRSDIWSLGIVLYEALSGRTPFADCTTLGSLFLAIHSERPSPIQGHAPGVSREIAAIVHRALANDVEARFQSAAELLAAVRPLLPYGQSIDESIVAGASRAISPTRKLVAGSSPPMGRLPPGGPSPLPPTGPSQPPAFAALPNTAGGVETLPAGSPRVARALVIAGLATGAVVLVGVGGLGLHRVLGGRSAAETSAVAAPPPPKAPPAPVEGPLEAGLPAPVLPSTPVDVPPLALSDAGPPGRPIVMAPAVRPVGRGAGAAPRADAGQPAARSDCSPNYYVDDQGDKHFKPECFSNPGR